VPGRARVSVAAWSVFAVLAAVIVGATAFGAGAFRTDWRSLLTRPPSPSVLSMPPRDERLPVPRRGELALSRARALASNGRLRDAIVVLDQVRPTDPQRAEAERLKIQIQRQLIELAGLPVQPDSRDGRQP
jgi:hypothetical protein